MSSGEMKFFSADDQSRLKELPEFQEMKMRAEAAEAKLRRIYNTPIWKFSKPIRKIYARVSQSLASKGSNKFIFTPDPNDGVPVVELTKDKLKIEANFANLSNDSIAVVAHFSTSNVISKSLTNYLKEISALSYSIILVSAAEVSEELIIEESLKSKITILRKPNLGYDFGSWAVAIDKFPEILFAQKLLLTNDSLIGPLADFSNIIKELESSKFDVTGVTDNSQLQYHIQSYLMLFKPRALENSNVRNLLKSVIHLELKNEVILKYELGLTRTAQLSGLFVGAIYPWNLIVQPGKNPSIAGWQRLLELGFPFLKREAVRLSSYAEVKSMKEYVTLNYQNSLWAIEEINSVSK